MRACARGRKRRGQEHAREDSRGSTPDRRGLDRAGRCSGDALGGDLYGYGSAELLQPAGDASAVLGDTLNRHVEETLDIGRPCPGESFEATHPYADDPLFRDPLEDIVEQEMQQFGDPYGLTGPSGTPEPIAPGFGFDGEEMGPLW